jgi:O-antigen ligase
MWSQVHNDYLQWAFEWGWLGGAMWVVLLVGGFAMAVRAAGRGGLSFFDATLAACAAFALGGLMLHATVDFPLQVLGLQMYAGVYLGLGWGSGRWPVEVREPRTAEGPPVPVVGEEVGEASFKFN